MSWNSSSIATPQAPPTPPLLPELACRHQVPSLYLSPRIIMCHRLHWAKVLWCELKQGDPHDRLKVNGDSGNVGTCIRCLEVPKGATQEDLEVVLTARCP